MSVEKSQFDEWVDLSLGPLAVKWNQGTLPNVEGVPFDCVIVLWSKDYVGMITPWGNEINPVRWADNTYTPRWGNKSPEGWWTWVYKGNKPRPVHVKTWDETYPE